MDTTYFETNTHRVVISYDEHAERPDAWNDDDDCFLVAFHNQMSVRRKDFEKPEDVEDWGEDYLIYSLSAYIHSGVDLYLGTHKTCTFDSGQVGFVLIRKDSSRTPEKAAQSIVDEWNMYLSGDVWAVETQKLSCGKCGTWERDDDMDAWGAIYGRKQAELAAEQLKQSLMGRDTAGEEPCNCNQALELKELLDGVTKLIEFAASDNRGLVGDNMEEYRTKWEPLVKRALYK